MSIVWYIYKAQPGAGPIMTWDTDRSEVIGDLHSVKKRLSQLYPKLIWSEHTFQMDGKPVVSHSALARDYEPGDDYLDFRLSSDADGSVRMIHARKASPKVVIAIMEAFGLDSVYQDQPGVMVDPYMCNADWSSKE